MRACNGFQPMLVHELIRLIMNEVVKWNPNQDQHFGVRSAQHQLSHFLRSNALAGNKIPYAYVEAILSLAKHELHQLVAYETTITGPNDGTQWAQGPNRVAMIQAHQDDWAAKCVLMAATLRLFPSKYGSLAALVFPIAEFRAEEYVTQRELADKYAVLGQRYLHQCGFSKFGAVVFAIKYYLGF